MGLTLITTAIFVTFTSSCFARMISQNAISSVLQEIMSPANTEKAMQIINMAASGSNRKGGMPDLSRLIASNDCGMPGRGMLPRNELALPGRIIANDVGVPRAIITNDGVSRAMSNEPRVYGPQVVREAPGNFVDSLIMPKEIYQTVPVALPQERVVYPYPTQAAPAPYLPVGPPNPYLPVASPMSAMSSSCMPPPTQSRGQFLRKIPIPPPTL